jgi:hypothetical protein
VNGYARTTATSYAGSCQLYTRVSDSLQIPASQRFPPTPGALLRFAAYAHRQFGKSHGVIAAALTAVRSVTAAMGFPTETLANPQLRLYMKHLRKTSPAKATKRLPITVWALAKMRHFVGPSKARRTKFGAMVVGLFGLLRASEYVDKTPYGCSLRRKHVAFSSDRSRATLHLTRSKTDVFAEGVDVVLHANESSLCPVMWLEVALDLATDRSPEAPVFQTSSGAALKYTAFQSFIRTLCHDASLLVGGASFSTHSLRIGGATSLIALGFDTAVVKLLGRWRSEAFQAYVRGDPAIYARVSAAFATAAQDSRASVLCGLPLDEFSSLHSPSLDSLSRRLRHVATSASSPPGP